MAAATLHNTTYCIAAATVALKPIERSMISKICCKILIFGYSALAILYLYASINNAYGNFNGNRTIGAILMLAYFSIMVIGLIRRSAVFSLISTLNFTLGTVFFVCLVSARSTEIDTQLLVYIFLGVLGIIISITALTFKNAL